MAVPESAGSSLAPFPPLSPPQRWLASLLMLAAGLALYLVGSPYLNLFPTNRDPGCALLPAHLKPGKSCARFKRLEQLPLDTVRQTLTETAAAQAAANS